MAGTRLKQKLTAIADSIRYKLPSTVLMTLDEMPPNIEDIVTHEIEDALIEGTLTGVYENNRVTRTNAYCFYSQNGLTRVILNNVVTVGSNTFLTYSNSSIEYIELASVMTINATAFRGCNSLVTLNLYNPSRTAIPTLTNTSAFTNTPIASGNGYIIINDEFVDELKQAENWSTYADQIIGHTQAIALGLITGASTESTPVPPPAPLQTIPLDRLDIDEINIDRDLDLDHDLDIENNERI